MDMLTLLAEARAAGLHLRADGDKLLVCRKCEEAT
jgi:hypothetical protein